MNFSTIIKLEMAEGTFVIYDDESDTFLLAFEYVFGNRHYYKGDEQIRDEIRSWGFNDIDDFKADTDLLDHSNGIKIFWIEA